MPKKIPKRRLKKKICISMSPEMHAKVQRIARREHRSVSSLLEYLIALEWRKRKSENKPSDPESGIYRLSRELTVSE
jgi:hypothetical protein